MYLTCNDCLVDCYVKVFEEAVHCSFEADRHISPETTATVTSTQGFPYLPWITIERKVPQHDVRKRATLLLQFKDGAMDTSFYRQHGIIQNYLFTLVLQPKSEELCRVDTSKTAIPVLYYKWQCGILQGISIANNQQLNSTQMPKTRC